MGNVDFSPEINMWGCRLYLWVLILRLKDGAKVSRRKIKRLALSCGVMTPMSNSREKAQ